MRVKDDLLLLNRPIQHTHVGKGFCAATFRPGL
jgi:hypothetical protein